MNLLRAPIIACMFAVCLTIAGPAGNAKAQERGSAERPPALLCSSASTVSRSPVLASFWNHIMGNRTRMVQVGLVAVCLGFFLLSWSRK